MLAGGMKGRSKKQDPYTLHVLSALIFDYFDTSLIFRWAIMCERRASERYRLRLHRARSVVLTEQEIVEVRAAQRTFEGAYIRTSLSQFSFALVVLKIFTAEFYSIGALFAVYGAAVMVVGLFRRQQGNKSFFSEVDDDGVNRKKFRTSGNVVVVMTALSVAARATGHAHLHSRVSRKYRTSHV
ncbi:hypothetical protein CIHG_04361 [Coccidioides immitis H538.4]|uniref:Uncharacterized protein n=1 Tax=Coccidioides immitis H538.4 TaxID=396776 RepID=A0A0J8UGN9_COCIT|nr:hypothetical protein CIHG_04361 [Coccidioides immitis H538.4]